MCDVSSICFIFTNCCDFCAHDWQIKEKYLNDNLRSFHFGWLFLTGCYWRSWDCFIWIAVRFFLRSLVLSCFVWLRYRLWEHVLPLPISYFIQSTWTFVFNRPLNAYWTRKTPLSSGRTTLLSSWHSLKEWSQLYLCWWVTESPQKSGKSVIRVFFIFFIYFFLSIFFWVSFSFDIVKILFFCFFINCCCKHLSNIYLLFSKWIILLSLLLCSILPEKKTKFWQRKKQYSFSSSVIRFQILPLRKIKPYANVSSSTRRNERNWNNKKYFLFSLSFLFCQMILLLISPLVYLFHFFLLFCVHWYP